MGETDFYLHLTLTSVIFQVIERLGELAPAALLGEEQFFLGWGLHRPHLPFVFPQRFLDFYPEVNLPRCCSF